MDWPVVQRDVDALRTRIASFHRLQIAQEGLVIEGAARPSDQASSVGIQTACNAPRGVVAGALRCPWRIAARRRVVTIDRGTAVIRQFILIEQHAVHGIRENRLPSASQTSMLAWVVRIRRMHVAPAALVGDVKTLKQLPDARQAHRCQPGHRLPQRSRATSGCVRSQSTRGSGARFRPGQPRPPQDLEAPAPGEKAGLRPRPACTCKLAIPPRS